MSTAMEVLRPATLLANQGSAPVRILQVPWRDPSTVSKQELAVYIGSLDGNLYVLELKTGKQVQKIELDGKVTGAPAVVDGKLQIGTDAGTLFCFGK